MKNLDLNVLGVQEMNAEEMRENNGGFIALFSLVGITLGLAVVGAGMYASFKEGYNAVQ